MSIRWWDWRGIIRVVGFVVLSAAAVHQFISLDPGADGDLVDPGPPEVAASTFEAQLEDAESDNDLNQVLTDSAPQQSVANGWYTNDLLAVGGLQTDHLIEITGAMAETTSIALEFDAEAAAREATSTRRLTSLLLIGVLTVAWHGATISFPRLRRSPGFTMRPM